MQFRNTLLVAALACTASSASAQWITFTNQTGTRMPTGAGQNNPALTTACPEEKDYTWGDVDRDGDLDLVCVRKRPMSCEGGRPNNLFMNEGGVLIDRASTLASAAIGVPAGQGTSLGFLDSTNDRQAILVDMNNDGWLDIITAPTMSDGLPRYIGHPRVYMNRGEVAGVWQGFRYEYDRFPQLLSKTNVAANPRFCSVSAGDLTGDGYVDLYFSDYDTPEAAYCPFITEAPANDMDNKFLVNQGAANPGYFVDEGNARMNETSPAISGNNIKFATFGAHNLTADMNGDAIKDVVKVDTLDMFLHIAIKPNLPSSPGNDWGYIVTHSGSPYSVGTADLNGDGKLDLLISNDAQDRYAINTTPIGGLTPSFTEYVLTSQIGAEAAFSGANTIVDLDNDGWNDAFVADQDLDTTYSTARRARFYHNLGPGHSTDGLQLREDSPAIISTTAAKGVYNIATLDINGDGWRDVVLGKGNPLANSHTIGSTEIWMNNGKPAVSFTYPGGRPASLAPGAATNFNVQLNGLTGGTPAANSGKIFISVNGGAFTQTNMTSLGGNLYQATIPAVTCGGSVRYYFSGQTTTLVTFTDPVTLPLQATPSSYYLAGAYNGTSVALSSDFEAGAGAWTVANDVSLLGGAWDVAVPIGTWNEGFKAAPDSDSTPAGVNAFVTQNGLVGGSVSARDVDGGPTHLISPTINLAGSNATITFARWFYSNDPNDVLQISVSNDNGTNWTSAMSIKPPPVANWNAFSSEYQQTQWVTTTINVGDYVTPTSQVKVRFTANDVTPTSLVEAGIDDVVVSKYTCAIPCPADVNSSGAVNIDDLVVVITSWGATRGPADINNDNIVNIDDLVLVITGWGNCP